MVQFKATVSTRGTLRKRHDRTGERRRQTSTPQPSAFLHDSVLPACRSLSFMSSLSPSRNLWATLGRPPSESGPQAPTVNTSEGRHSHRPHNSHKHGPTREKRCAFFAHSKGCGTFLRCCRIEMGRRWTAVMSVRSVTRKRGFGFESFCHGLSAVSWTAKGRYKQRHSPCLRQVLCKLAAPSSADHFYPVCP